MSKYKRLALWLLMGSVFLVGGLCFDNENGKIAGLTREFFLTRQQSFETVQKGILFFPGTDQVQYEGEYILLDPQKPRLPGLPLPEELKHNPFVEAIKFEALVFNNYERILLPQGQGKLYDQYGCMVYQGGWLGGYRHGEGIEYFEDGRERYRGEYELGARQGQGKLYVLEKDKYYLMYQGTWKYQCFHGQGSQYDANGKEIFSGWWYFGELQE